MRGAVVFPKIRRSPPYHLPFLRLKTTKKWEKIPSFMMGKVGTFCRPDTPAREKIFPKILKNTRERGIIQRFGDDDKYGGDYTRGRTMNCFEA